MKHRNTKQRGNQCETRVEAKIRRNSRISSIWKHSRGFDVGFANETRREIDNFINVEKKKKRNSEKFSNFFPREGKEGNSNKFHPTVYFLRFLLFFCPLFHHVIMSSASKQVVRVGSLEANCTRSFRKLLPSFAHLSRSPLPPTFPQTALQKPASTLFLHFISLLHSVANSNRSEAFLLASVTDLIHFRYVIRFVQER